LKKNNIDVSLNGYVNSFLGDWSPNGYIFNKIKSTNDLTFTDKFSNQDRIIIEKIFDTVQRINKNEKPRKFDFLPKGFEDKEASKLEEGLFWRYLVYRYRYNINPYAHLIEEYPPCVQIEPTSICNFRCVMCYQADKSFSNKSNGYMGYMPLENFKKIIDELEGKVEAITLASRGEPLLHPDIKEMITYVGKKFLGFKINTNASLLTEDLSHTILQSGLQTLVFSIDAADKESYEKIRVNGNFDKVLANVIKFNEIKEKFYPESNLITKISGVYISDEMQSYEDLVSFWKNKADEVAFVHYLPWESSYSNKINNQTSPCSDLWRRMFIWHDGKVNPCDYDYKTLIFGNQQPTFPENSISDIWNSEQYNNLREQHILNLRGKVEPCKRCVSI